MKHKPSPKRSFTNKLTRFHIFISFFIHLVVVALFVFFDGVTTIHRNFIVFGVHSRKPSRAIYKPHDKPIPFVGDSSGYFRRRDLTQAVRSQKNVQKNKQVKISVEKKTIKTSPIVQKNLSKNKHKKVQPKRAQVKKVRTKIAKKKQPKTALVRVVNKKKKEKVETKMKQRKKNHVSEEKEIINPIEKKKVIEEKKVLIQQEPEKEINQQLLQEDEQKKVEIEKELQDFGHAPDIAQGAGNEMLEFSLAHESDVQMKQYHRCVQKEVERLWRPPVGVPKSTECQVGFIINKYGKVEHFEYLKRSNILIYDLSISRVAKKFAFDECLWGKRFTINFRQ
ncbi:MAG: hypothetical protein V1855_01835 [bacterium]